MYLATNKKKGNYVKKIPKKKHNHYVHGHLYMI